MRSPSLLAEIEAARERLHKTPALTASGTVLAFPQRGKNLLIAAAAMILAATGAALFLYPTWHRSSKPMTAAQTTPPTHPRAPSPTQSANNVIAAAHPAVFFLPAIHLRGADQAALTLMLPQPPATLEIQVEIRGKAPESVTLRQKTAVIATQNHPTLRTAGPITYLSFLVDPAKLVPGHCLLEIRSENGLLDRRPFLIHQTL